MAEQRDYNDANDDDIKKARAFLEKMQYSQSETDIKDFDYKAFANDLARQAGQVIPDDIQGDDRKFIVDIISRFSIKTGGSLVEEENSALNVSQACLIVQFIAEWIYHKSIDIIRGGIEPEFREEILLAVAFSIFEVAKKAINDNLPQNETVELLASTVDKSFAQELERLTSRNFISEETARKTLLQSNIDESSNEENIKEDIERIEKLKLNDRKTYILAIVAETLALIVLILILVMHCLGVLH